MTTLLNDRYRILYSLGSGGFGETFLAEDTQMPSLRRCVIKQLKPLTQNSLISYVQEKFYREATLLEALGEDHPQIPKLYAYFTFSEQFYLVQEWIEGDTLLQKVAQHGPMSDRAVLEFLLQILPVLDYIHSKGIIHRDIKPSNIILRYRDGNPVLIDFGAVKETMGTVLDPQSNAAPSLVIGTPGFMPAEQAAGRPVYASDLYSLGVTAVYLLTGKLPKDLETSPVNGEILWEREAQKLGRVTGECPSLGVVLDRVLQPHPGDRFATAAEMLEALRSSTISPKSSMTLDNPEGQVRLDSAFYVDRPPIEADCYETIVKPGALIRVKAPRQMGKTSLLTRILHHAKQQGYQTASLNFQSVDAEFLANLEQFLQWFCASIAYELNLEDKLDEYWKGVLGSKNKCTNYFQRYLLSQVTSPLVLGLDEVDQLFQHPEIAADFFGLLRAWHEKAKNEASWKKLRLVIVHSKEVYVPLNINQSPFNVGLPIELPELSFAQVEYLVKQHEINWSEEQIQQAMAMFGGHPYLVRLALYEIARDRITLERLLQVAPTEQGPYYDHLRRHLLNLESDPNLVAAIGQVVKLPNRVQIGTAEAFKLRSMGLVKFVGNAVMPLCNLYRLYFSDRLGMR